MITLQELLGNFKFEDLDAGSQNNLLNLLEKMNKIRKLYGKPMVISSGVRTKEDQIRIYKEKAAKEGKSFEISKVPMKSKHLLGAAVDIYDPKQELQKWCLSHTKELESLGIWMEDFKYTKNWCHFQCLPYGSWKEGKSIFFIP